MGPVLLQVVTGFGGIAIALVLSVLIVAFGTYVGVLMALQSFFGADAWDEVGRTGREGQQ